MNFQLLLFDLDNTLLRTDVVEAFRGNAGLFGVSPFYLANLKASLPQVGVLYTNEILQVIRKKYPDLKMGVFTRAPRLYTDTLLQHFYPNQRWDVVVCFQDVHHTTPPPEGIWLAMQKLNLEDFSRVAMVGDSPGDIMAACQAGAWSILDLTIFGGDKPGELWNRTKLVADIEITNPNQLLAALERPPKHVASAEAPHCGG